MIRLRMAIIIMIRTKGTVCHKRRYGQVLS